MATKKQYFRATMKHQNKWWGYCLKYIKGVLSSEYSIKNKQLLNTLANCYTKIWMYIASEDFENDEKFEGLIDNIHCDDVRVMVDDCIELNKIKSVSEEQKTFIGYEIYNGLFASLTLEEYQDYVYFEKD